MTVNHNEMPGIKESVEYEMWFVAITKGMIYQMKKIDFNMTAPEINSAPTFVTTPVDYTI